MATTEIITSGGWVSADGSYGAGGIIVFDHDKLTEQQWETLCELRDNEKYDYVFAILNNQDLSLWEEGE